MHTETIRREWAKVNERHQLARKVFLSYPTRVFQGREDMEFDIHNAITDFFGLQYGIVQVSGSAKTGYSYIKQREFIEGKSDLDIAIISPDLFMRYMEVSYKVTKGYKDLSKFSVNRRGENKVNDYRKYITRGFFRPDLMPYCDEKRDWYGFFNKLSGKYYKVFKNINAGIFATQGFFEYKQVESLAVFMDRLGGGVS